MRLLILSDLHDDFWADGGRDPFDGIEDTLATVDLLLLAGDVSNKPTVRWKYAFDRLAQLLPLDRVAVFPGNHDFYDFRIDGEDRLAEIAADHGVAYVQKRQITLGSVRILCATLWTDFELGVGSALNKMAVSSGMNDFKKIRVASQKYRRLWPSDLMARHRDHLNWLIEALNMSFAGRTFVATHHAPHPSVLPQPGGSLDAAYASDLSGVIEAHQPEKWFFGHCHGTKNGTLGETALCNVSLGYPDEVDDPAARIKSLIFDI